MRRVACAALFQRLLLILAISLASAAPVAAWAQDDDADDDSEVVQDDDAGDDAPAPDDDDAADDAPAPGDDDTGDDGDDAPDDDDAGDDEDDAPVSQPAPDDDDAGDDGDDGDDAPVSQPAPDDDDDGTDDEDDRDDDLDDPRPNQVIVRLRPGIDGDGFAARYGASVLRTIPAENIYLFGLDSGQPDDDEVAAFEADPDVAYAELNYTGQAPEGRVRYFFTSGHGDVMPVDAPGLPAELDLPERSCVAGAGITVAVLDTGVDANHPMFAGAILSNGVNMVDNTFDISDSGNGVDDDADGAVDEMTGHGTHVSGVVNQVAPEAGILPVKVLDSDGTGDAFVVAAGIYYALEQGADVINLSLGSTHQSRIITEVVEFATAQGVPVVAAAGNMGVEIPAEYPAAEAAAVMVAATDSAGSKAGFSNFHPEVDLSAPGVDIASSYPGGGYVAATGTSMAAPMVTGTFALMLGQDSQLSLDAMLEVLASGADSIAATDPAWDGKVGPGRLNIGASIACGAAG